MGTVDPDIVWDLGFIYGPVLMLFYFLALASISFYQITRMRVTMTGLRSYGRGEISA